MKRKIWFLALVGAVVGAFALGQASGQEDEKGDEAGGMGDMSAWMELGTPGPEHAEFKKMVGEWTCEAKSWMVPGADPVVDQGKCTFSMVLDDRILRQDYQGAMAGTPFTGLGFTAFNKATAKYEAIWMDSMSTGIFVSNGTEKQAGETWEYEGSFYGPGGMEIVSRMIMRKVSDDEHVMEMYNDMGQGEMKSMEMTYRRVKK